MHWLSSNSISPMLGTPLPSKKTIPNKNITFLLDQYEYYSMRKTHLKTLKADPKTYIVNPLPKELKTKLDQYLLEYFRLAKPLTELYTEIETLIAKYPNIPQILLEYANMRRFGGDLEKSVELIQTARSINPHFSVPKYMQARVVSVKGKPYAGKEIVDEVHKNYAVIDHTLLEIRYLSSACLNTRSKSHAFKLITAYVCACPDDMRAALNQVYTLYALQDTDQVLEYSKRFLDKYEYDACVVYYRARAYAQKGNRDEAFKHFDIVLNRSKEPMFLAQCYYDKALLRSPDTEFPLMVQDLEAAHKLYPKINGDVVLSDLYRSKGNYKEALEWLDRYGTRIDKANDIFYNRLCAEINAGLGNNEEAVRCYLALIEQDGAHSAFYTLRLNSLLQFLAIFQAVVTHCYYHQYYYCQPYYVSCSVNNVYAHTIIMQYINQKLIQAELRYNTNYDKQFLIVFTISQHANIKIEYKSLLFCQIINNGYQKSALCCLFAIKSTLTKCSSTHCSSNVPRQFLWHGSELPFRKLFPISH
eukprot:TRINITY_DN2245_c2_g1_i1.p1 TRINITY_DN2245_c2_g1~~TRINITY_DN2245_c2_g1_i1.p1  ORF type:complete len:607 (-),score=22.37 TRINITY_DN2245_c2_g1_i1:7291-8880(-)